MAKQRGDVDRRSFLGFAAMAGAAGAWSPGSAFAAPIPGRAVTPGFRQDPERVSAVVGASHSNFERVRELVEEQPALAKATWDWGFGDWETALGAASHTGRREIAEFLIGHGARPTLFSAAMLGQVDVVRAALETDPSLFTLDGPHGISLLRHARAGREQAQTVVDYLLGRFGEDERPFGYPGDEAVEARYAGVYVGLDDPAVRLSVGVANGWLLVGGGQTPQSRVLPVGEDAFHPTGAPGVVIHFRVEGSRASRVTVTDGPERWEGALAPLSP